MACVNTKCYLILSCICIHLFLESEAGHIVFTPEDNDKEVLDKDTQRNQQEANTIGTPKPQHPTTTTLTQTPGRSVDGTNEDPCAKHPCSNGGLCRPDSKHPNSQYHCLCQAGYVGKTCGEVMRTCDSLKCIRQTECVSSQGGAICICDTGDKGQLCGVNQATSHSEAKEPVLTDPTKHQLVLVFGLTMSVISLAAVILCIHCRRASTKSKMLREDYKTKIRAGSIPEEVPPDLLDVSNALCCCGSTSKLMTKYKDGQEGMDSNINAKGIKHMQLNNASKSASRSPVWIRKPGKPLNKHRQRSYNNSSQTYIKNLLPGFTGNPTSYNHHRTTDKAAAHQSLYSDSDKAAACQSIYSDSLHPQNFKDQCCDSPQEKFPPFRNPRSRKLLTKRPNYLNLYKTQPFKKMGKNRYTNSKNESSKDKTSHPVAEKESHLYNVKGISHSTCLDPYTSSSSEEEIYLRPVQSNAHCSKSRLLRNTSSEMDSNSEERGSYNPGFTSNAYQQDTLTFPLSISPDAKKNVCTNNSIAKDAEIKPLPGYARHSVDENKCGKDMKKTATNNQIVINLENLTPLYNESGADSMQDNCNEEVSYDKDYFSKMRGTAKRSIPAIGIYKLPNIHNTDISGLNSIDETGQDSLNTATSTSDVLIKPHTTDTSILLQSPTVLQPLKPEDFNDNNINDKTGVTENRLHDNSTDDKYLKKFVEEGSTLYYVSDEPLADKADTEDDFDVVPDGKGSLMLISKSVKD